jgi:hypothetical protein
MEKLEIVKANETNPLFPGQIDVTKLSPSEGFSDVEVIERPSSFLHCGTI